MAVSNIKNSTALVLRFEKGENLNGTPRISSQKYSKINATATDAQLYEVGAAIGAVLTSYPVEIKKIDDFSLVGEA